MATTRRQDIDGSTGRTSPSTVGTRPATTTVINNVSTGTALPPKTASTAVRGEEIGIAIPLDGQINPKLGGNRGFPPTPQPVPDPEPKPPFEIPAGDPKTMPGTKGLDQNPERYREGVDKWTVQAEPQIVPLELVKGRRPELKPVLWADGVIVKIGDEYICSKRTLADIMNSGNPHYDIAVNGMVLNRPMGKSVPIIQLDVTKLKEMGDQRDRVNRYAGVKSVDYVNESAPVEGTNIPQGLLNQINWTLVEELERYPDRFEVWDILASLKGNYNIESLRVATEQEEGKLDKEKLAEFMKGVAERLKTMRRDFNIIKNTFYAGEPPPGTVPILKYVRVAKTIDPAEEESKNSYVVKTTEMVGLEDNPLIKVAGELDKGIKGVKGDLGDLKSATNTAKTGAGDQKAALIAKWQSYKWTVQEAEYLKTVSVKEIEEPPTRTSNRTSTGGKNRLEWLGYEIADKIVGISRVQWTPAMEVKAAIIVPLPASWGTTATNVAGMSLNTGRINPIIDKRTEERLIGLYGTPPGYNPNRIFNSNQSNDTRNELWWMEQNAKRQAEIVRLAYDIHKIELETGKTIPPIQPAGVAIGGQAVTSLGNRLGGRKP